MASGAMIASVRALVLIVTSVALAIASFKLSAYSPTTRTNNVIMLHADAGGVGYDSWEFNRRF
jgi:hypothetical protein